MSSMVDHFYCEGGACGGNLGGYVGLNDEDGALVVMGLHHQLISGV